MASIEANDKACFYVSISRFTVLRNRDYIPERCLTSFGILVVVLSLISLKLEDAIIWGSVVRSVYLGALSH